jgi:hypothetical protein
MPAKRSLVTQRLLGSFFENLEPLPAYLERILPDNAKVHLDQVFVPPLNTTSSLAKGLERLQNSLVGSRINDGNYPWDLKTSWSVPTSEEVQMGGNLSEVSPPMVVAFCSIANSHSTTAGSASSDATI